MKLVLLVVKETEDIIGKSLILPLGAAPGAVSQSIIMWLPSPSSAPLSTFFFLLLLVRPSGEGSNAASTVEALW